MMKCAVLELLPPPRLPAYINVAVAIACATQSNVEPSPSGCTLSPVKLLQYPRRPCACVGSDNVNVVATRCILGTF
jgi:hypothetical protein